MLDVITPRLLEKKENCNSILRDIHFEKVKKICTGGRDDRRIIENLKSTNPSPHSIGLNAYTKIVLKILQEKETISTDKIFDTVFKELHRDGDHVQEISPNRKNINRRLGDVLNSFEAIGMILKGRNIVKWIGYPNYDKEEEEAEKKTLTVD
ncbi:Transcription factor Dp-1 [Exaiptasia diaphana]|nr:Transcription factor Dp-1 [Exaiptasia diaphana]